MATIEPRCLCNTETFDRLAALQQAILEHFDCATDYFRLGRFDGADADLEEAGCTGIRGLIGLSHGMLRFVVGGYKTVSDGQFLETDDASAAERYTAIAQDLVATSGYGVFARSDGWTVLFARVVEVLPIASLDAGQQGEMDIEATAAEVVLQAKRNVRQYRRSMARLSEELQELYDVCMAAVDGEGTDAVG